MSLQSDWDAAKPAASSDLQSEWDTAKPVATKAAAKASAPAPQPKEKPAFPQTPEGWMTELGMPTISSMVAGPAGNLAGLGEATRQFFRPTGTDPAETRREVQDTLSYQPRTKFGEEVERYNPMALVGRGVDWLANKAQGLAMPPDTRGGVLSDIQRGAARGLGEAVRQAPGVALPALGERIAGRIPERQAALDVQRGVNAPKDTIREQSQKAGLITPPEGKHWLTALPGMGRVEKWISAADREKATRLVAQDIGVPEGVALTPDVLKNVRTEAGKKYQALIDKAYGKEVTTKQPPKVSESKIVDERGRPFQRSEPQPDVTKREGLAATDEFRTKIGTMLSDVDTKLKADPETFKALRGAARLLRQYRKEEFDPRIAMEQIKQLRHDAATEFKSDDPSKAALAVTRKEIANQLEDLFEANLLKSDSLNRTNLVAEFRAARRQIAKSYDIERALEPDGSVNLQKLAALSQRRPFTDNMKLVADFARTYPKAAQKVGELPRLTFTDFLVGGGAAVAGHPGYALTEIAARLGIPEMAQRGMFQSRKPSYSAATSLPYTLPPLGFATANPPGLQPPPQGQ